MIVAGIDLGSLATKTIIMDASKKILSYNILRSGPVYEGVAETSMSEALKLAGLRKDDISYIVSTGYGRRRAPFADAEITEITCHARGAKESFPQTHTIIDIGGQDSKAILIDDRGGVVNFIMNDKCAAGTGRFLEVMAGSLEVSLEEMGELSSQSEKDVEVSSTCTVFAESEVVSLRAQGCDKIDIIAALHRAIARRISGMVGQLGLREKVAMTGGVAKNIGVVQELEKKLHTNILVPKEPQINGALGAAFIALERIASGVT
jgi:predicted CoA-substrate-specific enzyme activase